MPYLEIGEGLWLKEQGEKSSRHCLGPVEFGHQAAGTVAGSSVATHVRIAL